MLFKSKAFVMELDPTYCCDNLDYHIQEQKLILATPLPKQQK